MVEWSYLIIAGFALILLGMFLIFAGVLAGSLGKPAKVEGGGVIMIGPIPIIFGTSTTMAIIAAVLALLLIIAMIVLMIVMSRTLVV